MERIIPIRDLRKGAEISEYVNSSGEPLFVTRNGYSDMVIMSMKSYEKNFFQNEIYQKITDSIEMVENGAKPKKASTVFADLEARYGK